MSQETRIGLSLRLFFLLHSSLSTKTTHRWIKPAKQNEMEWGGQTDRQIAGWRESDRQSDKELGGIALLYIAVAVGDKRNVD